MDAVGLASSVASLASIALKIVSSLKELGKFVESPSPEYLEFQVYCELLADIDTYPLLLPDIHIPDATKSCLKLCQHQLSDLSELLKVESKRANTRALHSKEVRRRIKAFVRSVKTLKDLLTE